MNIRVLIFCAATAALPGAAMAQADVGDTVKMQVRYTGYVGKGDHLGFMQDGIGPSTIKHMTANMGGNEENFGLMQLDLSAYPGYSVSSATLNAFHDANQTPGAVFGIFRNTSPWRGVTTDWDSRPSYDPTPVSTLTISDTATEVFRSFDIQPLLQGWMDGSFANYGMTFQRIDDPNPVAYFVSGGDLAGDRMPNVVFTISAVPEPVSVAMLVAGLAVLGGLARRELIPRRGR